MLGSFVVQGAARSTTDSTGPALIELQDLFASVAEANTAAAAAHLSVDVAGVEDRVNRNLYDDALGRAHQHLAAVSADIGQSAEAQNELQNIGAALASYSGAVESARLAKLNQLPDANQRLSSALNIVDNEIAPSVNAITAFGQQRYTDETDQGELLIGLALPVGMLSLAAMVIMQIGLARRTRRVFNPLLVLSTLALAGLIGLLTFGNATRVLALSDADTGGYDAIGASSEMQNIAFDLQSQLALALLDEPSQTTANSAEIDELISAGDNQILALAAAADSDREQAAARTLQVRWSRYLAVIDEIRTMNITSGQTAAAALFQGDGVATFNGVNTAIESVLLDNRDQFSDGIQTASDAVEFNPWWCLFLTVVAALLAIVAIQRRLADYR